jgi:hypothetical protein
VAIDLMMREQPIRFAKLPTLFRQVLTLNSDSLPEQESVLAKVESLIIGKIASVFT